MVSDTFPNFKALDFFLLHSDLVIFPSEYAFSIFATIFDVSDFLVMYVLASD